jgi:hypothetical protein
VVKGFVLKSNTLAERSDNRLLFRKFVQLLEAVWPRSSIMKDVHSGRFGASLVLVAALSLSACGGGGGGDTPSPQPPAAKTFKWSVPTDQAKVSVEEGGPAEDCLAVTVTASGGEMVTVTVAPAISASAPVDFVGSVGKVAEATYDSKTGKVCIKQASNLGMAGEVISKELVFTASAAGYDPATAKVNLVFTGVGDQDARQTFKVQGARFPILMSDGTYRSDPVAAHELSLPTGVTATSVSVDGVAGDLTFRQEDWTSLGLGVRNIARPTDATSLVGCWEAVGSKVTWVPSCYAVWVSGKYLKGDQKVTILGSDGKVYIFRLVATVGSIFKPEVVSVGQVIQLTDIPLCVGAYSTCLLGSGSILSTGYARTAKTPGKTAVVAANKDGLYAEYDSGYGPMIGPLPGN